MTVAQSPLPYSSLMEMDLMKPVITEKKRDYERIKQNLYIVEVKFSGLTKTCTLSWSDLDFDENTLAKIRKSNIRLRGIPLFEQLEEKAKELRTMRKDLERRRTVLVGGERLVTESQFQNCIQDIINMKKAADLYREELLEERDRGLDSLLIKVRGFLESFNVDPDVIAIKLKQIESNFPSEIEISTLLKVRATYTRISSLVDQLEKEKEAELLFNHQLELDHIRELRDAQDLEIERLKQLKNQIFDQARQSILDIVSEHLLKLTSIEIGKPHKRLRDRLKKHVERLGAFLDLDISGNIKDITQNLNDLKDFFESSIDFSFNDEFKVAEQFNELKQKLEASYQLILEASEQTETIIAPSLFLD